MKLESVFTDFKKILTAMLLATICIGLAQAEPPLYSDIHGPKHLVEILAINEDQQAVFVSIMESQHVKRLDVHAQYEVSRKAEREAMEALHGETVELLQWVLSPDQLDEFSDIVEHSRPRGPRPGRD
ncbi:MAG: hypothetical protein V7785_14440 [Bermanella sp.]